MKKLVIPFILVLILTSCKVEFNSTLRSQLEDSKIDLTKIQFYNSTAFELYRELSSNETGIESGKIKIVQGKKVEIIKIAQNTPAACALAKKDTLLMIFEEGNNKKIPFVCSSYNNYKPITSKEDGLPLDSKNFYEDTNIKFYGTIMYDNKEYYYGYKIKPRLLVEKQKINNVLKNERRIKRCKNKLVLIEILFQDMN